MKCPICNQKSFVVYKNHNMPYGISLNSKCIDLKVDICSKCNFVFQSSAYTEQYNENISTLYKSYKISDMYNFPNRNYNNLKALEFISEHIDNTIEFNVLEIGSNRGDFLYLLKERFNNINILGCEPTEFKDLKVPTINSFFEADLFNTKFDLIVLRHTLEHIKFPKDFVETLSKVLKNDGKVFIEVPNLINSLKNFIEDFTPDHVNYFTTQTLQNIFQEYDINKVDDTEFIYVLFQKQNIKTNKSAVTKIDTDKIIDLFQDFNKHQEKCYEIINKYQRIIFYGISNFYLWTYVKLKPLLEDKDIYYTDDNITKDKLFNLKKIDSFQKGDLVILCTSNKQIQNQMCKNLPEGVDILYLWEGIKTNV
ncbi:class I SAM-dependent methyltransferase [Arcobacter sp. FWKO B]|uniref:class I SAM-dependent methyltransferase n=1 Tax=Arcobacter sp. FWKO B TaxID=2593672 RepID=UPI0018A5F9F9|nr:class I SAM-dependent methyltransferase [Arcobacter sp. FWKO B]QOG12158.1 class I SAM-dependent methyltransferase [Arcobacter sp. FWKO B]